MKLALDLDSLTLVSPDDFTSSASSQSARKGDVVPIELILVEDGQVVEVDSPTITIYVVDSGDYSNLLTSTNTFTKTNTGLETRYEASLDLSVAGVTGEFADGTVKSIDALLEVEVTTGVHTESSEPVEIEIHNSYVAP